MAIVTASDNSAALPISPAENPIVPGATNAAQAVTNDGAPGSILVQVTNDPIKYALFAGLIWIGYKFLKRRLG